MKRNLGFLLLGFFGLVNTSQAALNDLGFGLINDTTLNITWMKDANFVKTSCDSNNELWQEFDPINLANGTGRNKDQICSKNGRLSWFEAEAWIAVLNTQSYLGHNDWRQPFTAQPDAACSVQNVIVGLPNRSLGTNCANIGTELNHLFYTSLSNPNALNDDCFGTSPHCFQNTAPFDNPQSFAYWSGTETVRFSAEAWFFETDSGVLMSGTKDTFDLYVWPVRSGLTASLPPVITETPPVITEEPPVGTENNGGGGVLSIWNLGIIILLLLYVARRKSR